MFTVESFHGHQMALAAQWEQERGFFFFSLSSVLVDSVHVSLASVWRWTFSNTHTHAQEMWVSWPTSDFDLPEATHDIIYQFSHTK